MTQWICIHQPGNQLYLCEGETSAAAARACDEAHGIVAPDSSVSQVYMATPVVTSNDRPIATDGMGSWFGVDDLEIRMLPWTLRDAEEFETALKESPPSVHSWPRRLPYDRWFDRYLPERNGINPSKRFNGSLYGLSEADLEYIDRCPNSHVWTLVQTEAGEAIVPGNRFMNRIGYFVTSRPYGTISAPAQIYVNPDPLKAPTNYLELAGYEVGTTPDGQHAYGRTIHDQIKVFITERASDASSLSQHTGARARVFVSTSATESPPIDIKIDDLSWLPSLIRSAELQALGLIEDELTRLGVEYGHWLSAADLPSLAAEELLCLDLTDAQRVWLTAFTLRWEAVQDALEPA